MEYTQKCHNILHKNAFAQLHCGICSDLFTVRYWWKFLLYYYTLLLSLFYLAIFTYSLWLDRILELNVVRAMFSRSALNVASFMFFWWSKLLLARACLAASTEILHPAMMVWGCSFCSISFSASLSSSAAVVKKCWRYYKGKLNGSRKLKLKFVFMEFVTSKGLWH